jgi:hypothetical protein
MLQVYFLHISDRGIDDLVIEPAGGVAGKILCAGTINHTTPLIDMCMALSDDTHVTQRTKASF